MQALNGPFLDCQEEKNHRAGEKRGGWTRERKDSGKRFSAFQPALAGDHQVGAAVLAPAALFGGPVKIHLYKIYQVGVLGRFELAVYAQREGLV